ncbi:ABC-type transport auxiliary lipoprotein family protein [Marinospirillum insulare]|uniref:ABC-type transport auxiliary lipoprotein component domain-containing protein n=1 Tax=Marinospirillum insulare TaxID=217169 RepID=A0ABQ5ZX08_9GAMM|nr:ABC-type transport auxiliary lipoprotein family protein [Marinospirillum insulare]GLR62887.1 hypothetical protein GCM10007878_03220 [Marinospirillum insulare]
MRYFFSLVLTGWLLTGCTDSLLVPQPETAPQQWLLKTLPSPPDTLTNQPMSLGISLAVERPTAPAPLRTREIWYRSQEHQLSPFGKQRWAESLDQQVQQLISNFLGQQSWLETSLVDQPGYRSTYRLRITLQEWYLNTAKQQLDIAIQINLLDAQGNNLLQHQWNAQPQVTELTTAALLATSQAWLDHWAIEVSDLLYEQLKSP